MEPPLPGLTTRQASRSLSGWSSGGATGWLTDVVVDAVRSRLGRTSSRVIVSAVIGLAASVITGVLAGWEYAPSVGWLCAASVFLVWTWSVVTGMDAEETAAHATREDPSKTATQLLVLGASVASLGGVGYLLVKARTASGAAQGLAGALGVVSVAISWLVVHTLFTLRYALLYYSADDGVDFNQAAPPVIPTSPISLSP